MYISIYLADKIGVSLIRVEGGVQQQTDRLAWVRLGLAETTEIFVTQHGVELLDMADLPTGTPTDIQVWARGHDGLPEGGRESMASVAGSFIEEELEQDPAAAAEELVQGAQILTTAKYDDEYAKGTAHVRKAAALDTANESAGTLLGMANDKAKLKVGTSTARGQCINDRTCPP